MALLSTHRESWLRRQPRDDADCRLFCLPHAGAGASLFSTWARELPRHIDVCPIQLPGREERLREPRFRNLSQLAEHLATIVDDCTDIPFAFFGQSMGALIGFHATRVLRRRQRPLPFKLLMAARRPPQLPADRPFFDWPEADFIREVQQRYGGILPDAILTKREWLDIYLPILRADFEMIDTYEFQAEPPLGCDITAFGGLDDCISETEIGAWSAQTSSTFKLRMLPGGHFFVQSDRGQFLSALAEELSQIPRQEPGGR